MTVFTTQSTSDDLLKIRDVVLPGLAGADRRLHEPPGAGLRHRREAQRAARRDNPHDHVAGDRHRLLRERRASRPTTRTVTARSATFRIRRAFVTCAVACETTDERFTRDGSGTPIVIDTPQIPFTVVAPEGHAAGRAAGRSSSSSTASAGSATRWSASARPTRPAGFASIGIDAVAHGYRFFDCKPGAIVLAGHRQQLRRHGGAGRLRRRLGRRLQRELPHREPGLLPGLPQLPRHPRQLPPDLRRPDVAGAAAAQGTRIDSGARHDARRQQHLLHGPLARRPHGRRASCRSSRT